MGGKAAGEYRVVDYFMSMHMGICHGPVDALLGIYIKERDAWPGTTIYSDDDEVIEGNWTQRFPPFMRSLLGQPPSAPDDPELPVFAVATAEGPLTINRPDLFGGDKKEGGVKGTAYFLPGGPAQVLPEYLAAKLGLTSVTAPAYRGVSSVWFHGPGNKGFMWAQNNPYLPPMWFKVFRRPVGLNASRATIQRGANAPDANPAHIKYECLTNTDWGMGCPANLIDAQTFEDCGNVLFEEKLGLSMMWARQSTVQSFLSEVQDHIQSIVFQHPRTGLWTMKLIRGDYDPATLRVFGPDNCDATNRQRKSWGEMVNEITVTWTNPVNEEEESVTVQDPAGIAIQGQVVSETRNYYGVRNSELAMELAVRDLRSAGYPLFTCDLVVDRSAWDLVPGDVFKLTWPEDGIEEIIMRVGPIDYGKSGDMPVRVNCYEDIFGLEHAAFAPPPVTGWVDPSESPVPFARVQLLTVPLPALVANGLDVTTVDDQFPRAVPAILAQQTGADTYQFQLNGPVSLANGTSSVQPIGTFLQTSFSLTTVPIPAASQTPLTGVQLGGIIGNGEPVVAGMVMIGQGTDFDMEMAMLDSYNAATDTWTLARGVADTIPRAWPAGTVVWYIGPDFTAVDSNERVAGQTVEYRLQPRTSKGLLPIEQAPVESLLLTDRAYRPFRPANVTVGGVSFAVREYSGTPPATVPITWANRNRLMEDQVVRRWAEGNVTPEVGQTTTVRCFAAGTSVPISEYTGLTGTSFEVPFGDISAYSLVDIEVSASRDGFESLQNIKQTVFLNFPGYGNNYGNNYGAPS